MKNKIKIFIGDVMKKFVAILLSLMLVFNITACAKKEVKQVTCEQIIQAYEDAGYVLYYHNHNDPVYYDLNEFCNIEIRDPNDSEHNHIYITRYFTAEDAKAANEEYRYNAILWLFFGIFGEWRWMRKGVYGDIYYTTFDKEMVKPLKDLMK